MQQLSDFAEALMGIDDEKVGLNMQLMMQKRNKAPLYKPNKMNPQIQKI